MAGAGLGAALGSVVPVLGTAAGGIVGGILGALAGGMGGSGMAKSGLDCLIEDDAKKMIAQTQRVAEEVACDYLLLETEIPALTDSIKSTVTTEWLRRMFQAGIPAGKPEGSHDFAYEILGEQCARLLEARPKIFLPPAQEVALQIDELIEETAATSPSP